MNKNHVKVSGSNSLRMITVAFVLGFLLTLPGIVQADTKKGNIQLKEGQQSGVKIEVGDKLKGECNWYVNPDFFKKRVVSVQCAIKNPTKTPLYFGYYVAFFDKDGKLLATSGHSGSKAVEPSKETYVGNVLELPKHVIDKIASYQVSLLSEEKPFGE